MRKKKKESMSFSNRPGSRSIRIEIPYPVGMRGGLPTPMTVQKEGGGMVREQLKGRQDKPLTIKQLRLQQGSSISPTSRKRTLGLLLIFSR